MTESARQLYRRAVAMYEKSFEEDPMHPWLGTSLSNLAEVSQNTSSRPHKLALAVDNTIQDPLSDLTLIIQSCLTCPAQAYRKQGDLSTATMLLDRAIDILASHGVVGRPFPQTSRTPGSSTSAHPQDQTRAAQQFRPWL